MGTGPLDSLMPILCGWVNGCVGVWVFFLPCGLMTSVFFGMFASLCKVVCVYGACLVVYSPQCGAWPGACLVVSRALLQGQLSERSTYLRICNVCPTARQAETTPCCYC